MQPRALAAAALGSGLMACALFFLGGRYLSAWAVALAAALAAVVVGVRATRRARASDAPTSGVWMASGGTALGLVVLALVGLFAWEAMQRTGRHSSPEGSVLGEIRTLISAEAAYQAASGGSYGPPECLAAPTTCLQGYPVSQPTFLDSQLASLIPNSGYKRTFYPGAAAHPPADGKPGPKGGLASYAYVAVPERPGAMGTRGFCADSTGRICFTVDGSAPGVKDGLCDPACNDLR